VDPGVAASALDAATKTIQLSDGRTAAADGIVIAPGQRRILNDAK
jgi:hypothetical protein